MSKTLTPPPLDQIAGDDYEVHLNAVSFFKGNRKRYQIKTLSIKDGKIYIETHSGAKYDFNQETCEVFYRKVQKNCTYVFKDSSSNKKVSVSGRTPQMHELGWRELENRLQVKKSKINGIFSFLEMLK
jgi:hypothetical protein